MVSAHEKSNLTTVRSSVIDRASTPSEMSNIDPDQELVGKQLGYRVIIGYQAAELMQIWIPSGHQLVRMLKTQILRMTICLSKNITHEPQDSRGWDRDNVHMPYLQ